MSDEKNKITTKAGLMHKHESEIEPIELEDEPADDEPNANDSAEPDNFEDESVDEKLPRTGKHSIGKSGGHEGLH